MRSGRALSEEPFHGLFIASSWEGGRVGGREREREKERGRERLEVCNEGPVPGGRGAGESRRWNQEGHLWAIREK